MSPGKLVYLNYHIDAKRWPNVLARLERELSPLGYRFADNVTAADCPHVEIVVNKTREFTDEDVRRLSNLRGIILWGSEKWMLSFDEKKFPVEVRLLDVDRGSDVAEHAL